MVNKTMNVVSDDDEESTATNEYPNLQGYLNKWTNYLYGWQKRWIILKDGALSYYKTHNETGCGCRGAISLYKAYIKAHEFDPCRFDIAVNDCSWCLRADSPEEKDLWLQALVSSKQTNSSQTNLIRYGSSASLHSSSFSSDSAAALTFQKSTELKIKLVEIDTLRESLCKQVDNLFDQFAKYLPGEPTIAGGQSPLADFKVDVMTCKTTASSISELFQNCIELVSLQEDAFAKCLEQETSKRAPSDDTHGQKREKIATNSTKVKTENESRQNHEDEFYDAVEPGVETNDKTALSEADENENNVISIDNMTHRHRLSDEIERVTAEQVRYARMGIGKGGGGWQLFAEEGEMKMYKREEEVNGLVVDPLKACHFVHGFTAHEICNFFFKPEFRYEWEITLDPNGMTVLEVLSEDTIIFHQIHKRVWPAAQRDALFWSHIREVPLDEEDDEKVLNRWVVVNHSTDSESHPANANGKLIRVYMTICLMCETIVLDPFKDRSQLTRSDIACRIVYCAVVNPGGWAPSAALRVIYKKEYPRFLRKFTAYVTQKTKGKPIMF